MFGDNAFLKVLRLQAEQDLRRLPASVRRRATPAGRVARWHTIGELRAAAKRGLPRVIFDFIDGGANDELTVRRNVTDLQAIELCPRVLVDVSRPDTATTVLGDRVAFPLLSSPMGLLGLVHPDGELGVARAMHRAGTVAALSSMASYSVEELAEGAPGPRWFQMYVWRDRGFVAELVQRAAHTGYNALIVTVDVPRSAARDRDRRNGFGMPPRASLRSIAGGISRPGWSARALRRPRITPANVERRGRAGLNDDGGASEMVAYLNTQFDPTLNWDDLAWFRELWRGPLVVKGILHPTDAERAVAAGADAVIVSNHGGRQFDTAPSAIRALPAVVDAVGGGAEVYLDGGVRRGTDIMKAVALGARACFAGRPFAFGLGVAGEEGVLRAATILRGELEAGLALAGCPSLAALEGTRLSTRPAEEPTCPA
jgi:isopentenyl diphosphate isomerase/L-lactate dehydrogenase-like FMN-dependent dehydrogenase